MATEHVPGPAAERRPGTPSEDRSFRFLLTVSGAEGLGDALARAALPILAVSVLGLGTEFVGLLNAVGIAAFLLLGLPVGSAVDRHRRLPAMGMASLLRCFVLLALVLGTANAWLSPPLLFAAAILMGIADVVFTTAHAAVVPAVAGRRGLKRTYSRLAIINQTMSAGAAAAAGAVLAWLGMPMLLLLAAAAYALSRAGLAGVRVEGPAAPARKRERGQARRGFALLRRSPALAALTASGCLTNTAAMAGNTILPVYILSDLGVAPASYAALGVLAAAGAVSGAAVSPFLSDRLGLRRLRTSAALLCVPAAALAAGCTWLPGPELVWLAGQSMAWNFLVSVSAVAGAEVLPRSVPPHLLATVGAAQRTLTLGVMPFAALLSGAAGAVAGTVPVLWCWALLAGAAALPVVAAGSLDRFDAPRTPR